MFDVNAMVNLKTSFRSSIQSLNYVQIFQQTRQLLFTS